jgi:hypothetical protein
VFLALIPLESYLEPYPTTLRLHRPMTAPVDKALPLLLSLPLPAQDTSFNDRYEPTAAPGLAPSPTPPSAPYGQSAA